MGRLFHGDSLIYSLHGAAFKPLIYLLIFQHTNQPRTRTARSSLSRAFHSPKNYSDMRRIRCSILAVLPALRHTCSPAVLGEQPKEAGERQNRAGRDTSPLAGAVTPWEHLQQHQDPIAFGKVSLTKHLPAACSVLGWFTDVL